uniref:HYDIN axonemal central pair apparatus protein n=1 Tax=Fundulus heteroclitus TaxID=8078 RepID=A0A3Q2PEK1_FUNHE
ELVFQNFIPSQTYSLPLLLFNNDKVAHAVKLEQDVSEHFYVVGPESGSSKVAPGMTTSFMIFFTPHESKDYNHRLVCVTPRDRFEIPIRAIGPRAILDFRDEIRLPPCLVKASTEKTHFVCNIGNCKANFKLHTRSPFSVMPSSGTLDVGEGFQVTVVFHPMTVGGFQEDLLLHYDTGEVVHISLFGTSEELDICLEPEHVKLKKTYISLTSSETVSLTNRIFHIGPLYSLVLLFTFCPLSRENSVHQQREEKKEENMCRPIQCESDPTAIHHLPLLSRGLQERKSQAADDCLPTLSLGGITLEPAEGEIWPNTTANFIIVFQPEEAKVYQHNIYCDVTGSESTLTLQIKGEGLGPKLKLSYNLMDMKNVFIGDKDHYEVQMTNKGLIDAPFRFSRPDTTFGRCFSINPEEGVVPPGICQTVGVTFHSRILGSFSEDLRLAVTGRPQPLTLTFRGCVIGPTFHFNVYELNFGDVAFGFPTTQTCTLYNTSFVPMVFALHVMGDGLGSPSVSSSEQVSDLSPKIWQGCASRDPHLRPAEFKVHPEAGTVDAMSNVTIKVTLCSNTVKKYELALAVDVEGVGEEVMILPLNIVVEPAVLDFQRCYLDLPYEQNVRLINSTNLPACYGVLDQEIEESTTVLFGSSVPRGVVPPGSSKEIPVFMAARAVGRIQDSLRIAVFGSLQQPLVIVLSCIGEGPVVYVPVTQLKFGRIPVLMDVTRTLPLLNQSPIPAYFNTYMIHEQSFWRVEPSEGVVPPESQLELKIVAHLKDTLRFLDKLEVSVRDSRTHTVSLSATGSGTTIVSDKPFGPNLDLGTHFYHVLYQYPFKLTNHGLRHHRMFWKIGGYLASPKHVNFSGRTALPPISSSGQRDKLRRRSLPSSNREKAVFSLSPACVDLSPGCSVDMVLTASSDSPKIVHEHLVCDSIIGGHGCQETIMSVEVKCRFVAPVLSISSKQLNFYTLKINCLEHPQQDTVNLHAEVHFPNLQFSSTTLDFGCVQNCTETKKTITITNCSPLPLSYRWAFLEDQKLTQLRPRPCKVSFSHTKPALSCHVQLITLLSVITPQSSEMVLSVKQTLLSYQEINAVCSRTYRSCSVFDILPMYGALQPQDQQLVTFSFFGHENVCTEVVAQCSVEDGPTYDVQLRGEASAISYSLESTHLDFGSQLFQCVGEVEMCVRNTGKVGFEFSIINLPSGEGDEGVDKGQGALIVAGYIDAGCEKHLRVLYLPGIPEEFEKQFQLQVAFLPPQKIILTGVGVFPRIQLNLPQNLCMFKPALRYIFTQRKNITWLMTFEELIHLEVERLLVKDNALRVLLPKFYKHFSLPRFKLPEYVLDFGLVIPGKVFSQTVNIINNGPIPVSFYAHCKHLTGTGFTAEFDSVKNLPCGEIQTFTIKFDYYSSNGETGQTSVILPIQLTDGPVVQVQLCAVITMPSITVSQDTLQFDTVQCGMCQIRMIQLQNCESVPCHCFFFQHDRTDKVDKFLPLCERQIFLQEHRPTPTVFQMIPCSGELLPGERVNVLIKFSPVEGCSYRRRLVVHVSDSTQQVFITAQGQAEEAQLEFCPSVLELGPCLPFSSESKAEVTVKNLSSFPIEFYSLEFDTEYLKEEEILRLIEEYDENNMLLLPPRVPGEGLPLELQEYCPQLQDDGNITKTLTPTKLYSHTSLCCTFLVVNRAECREGINGSLGQSEMTPVSRAIARYMELDLSPEGLTTQNHKGIAIIVYGAPHTGKISMAAALACYYEAACLSIDAVVTEAIQNGTSPASLSARQLYDAAAADYEEKKAAEAGKPTMPCIKHFFPPEQLLIEILVERFQLNDCHRGIVINSLESIYTQCVPSTLQVVLKAFNNRKHIYVVNLFDTYDALKKRERQQSEAEEALRNQMAEKEERWLWELDQETFDALPDGNKESIIQRHLEAILDDLGLGSSDPVVLPPTTLSVVAFPKHREQLKVNQTCFTFLNPPGQDEDDEKKDLEESTQKTVLLKIWFFSESPGIFEQVYNFELAGSHKLYQLTCRGVCTYPTISKGYKSVPQETEGLQKTYVIKPGYFEFGPLLCSKTRERYKKNTYPENSERLVIHNNSGVEAEVQFSFQHDTQATTYLLDPPTMTLTPGQKEVLTVWAFPTMQGQIKDSLVCHIKENPEPVVIHFSCWGVQPQLELENKNLNFGRILLHKGVSRGIMMQNKSALPLSWTLHGVDALGDEFMMPQDQGVVQPNSSFLLSVHFKAKRPVLVKKLLRFEVKFKFLCIYLNYCIFSGTYQERDYNVIFEILITSMRWTMKIFFIFVFSVFGRQPLYTNDFICCFLLLFLRFTFERPDPTLPSLESMFIVSPQSGTLLPRGKPTAIAIACCPDKEVTLKEEPILSCQVAFFSFRFSFLDSRKVNNLQLNVVLHFNTVPFRVFLINSPSIQACLNLGIFSVSPCTGNLQPGSQQQINVVCVAEQLGAWNQGLLIDIGGRDPSLQPETYRLFAEVCKPGIVVDPASIFEECHLCPNSSQLSSEQFSNAEGIFVLDEKKFIFNNVLVGRSAQARFKLTNNSKVPCTLNLAIKYGGTKSSRQLEVFDLSATTLNISNQSHAFAVVTFTPQALRHYSAVFEATIKGLLRSKQAFMNQALEFQLTGEGTLPSVSVLRPAQENNKGNPVIRFGRTLVGRRHSSPLVLLNDGNVVAEVKGQLVHRATVRLNVNKQKRFEVSFCSNKSVTVETTMTVQVKDNQYSNTTIHVMGEAYQEIVSLDNISRSLQDGEDEVEDVSLFKGNYETLHFGDCHIDCIYQESFTLTNHSSSQVVRFEWPHSGLNVTFSPQVGHLHAGCSKEVTVTFCSSQPVTLKQQIRCKICQVEFKQPIEEVADWDDRQRTMKWQNVSSMVSEESQPPEMKKVMETDPEPLCSVIEGSQWELDLGIRAVCDYSKFSCSIDTIQFKDTMLLQTRLHHSHFTALKRILCELECVSLVTDESSRSRPGSSLARPSSAWSSVMSLVTGNPESPPFSVEPRIGTINPGVTQNFRVCFSPVEVAQFQGRLLCSIPNLQNTDRAPCITVTGQSLLPSVHFDLEESDYISRNCHSPRFSQPLDLSTRVLQFEAIGFSAPITRSFNVVNPTRRAYFFKWRCEDTAASPFCCLTSFGTILPGKKVEVRTFLESLWSFLIENQSLSFPFLCVGTAREPCVYLDRPYIDFGELIVEHKVEQTVYLVNAEEEPFHFSVLPLSLLSEDQQSSLSVKPMNGTVMSKNSFMLPLLVCFTPSLKGYVNFRLNLKVKKKSEPLLLTVKADFSSVFTLETSFELTGVREQLQHLELKPQTGAVEVGKQLQASVSFSPQTICNLQDVKLIVKLGPTFTLSIKGKATAPSLDFSFTNFHFGKCFLFRPGMLPSSQTLLIHNKDRKEVSVQCQFKNTAFLEVDFQPVIMKPGAVMEIPITFYPQKICRYNQKLTFVLNGCISKHVDIEGQGIEMKLEVIEPKQKKVKLGSVMVGQRVNTQVVLVNHSLLDLSFTLTLSTNTPLDPKDLSVSPTSELKLKSCGGSCKVQVQFSPHQHIPPFSAELQAKFADFLHPLLTIEGCCKGVEVHLDSDHLTFGAVVQHCQTSRKIVMINTGDAGARFHWQTNFPAELSIKPMTGYTSPGKDVPFEVTFAPVELSNDIRYENLSCFIKGSSPVKLTVTGSCIPPSTSKEVVSFSCRVRSFQTQSLSITNPSSESCTIRPVIKGEQWSAALFLTFEPNQTKTFDITYRPLTMTPDGSKHLGSVFFSFPAGRGMFFNLQGTASPPKAEDTIMHELPAKTEHCEVLLVSNWLPRFCVLLEIVKAEKIDPTVFLKGHDSIEVPALTKRDYKMSFFAYREGEYSTKVTFRNEVTGEYLFYLVNFKVRPPGILSTIELETPVRQVTSAALHVENPLPTATSFTTECKCGDVKAPPQHTVPGQSKGVLSLEYLPLHVGESTTRLTLLSNDLGHFYYNLLLRALPPPTEETVHFQAALGNSHSVPIKFTNYSHLVTKYYCKTDCPDFITDRNVSASAGFPSGSEVKLEARFEPQQLGEVRGRLTLASEIGGEYVFPLHGVCTLPRPQGPFSITAGGSVAIPFKNVFLQATAFSFQVDNPCFTVKEVDSIPSKKTQNIMVSFEAPPGGSPGPWFGKLTISTQRLVGPGKPCSWVFYLKGQRPQSSTGT